MEALNSSIQAKLDELRAHMEEEGESLAVDEAEDAAEIFELKAKLTGKPGAQNMFLVPSYEDWIHDALDDVTIIAGTIYAEDEPFVPGSTALTGYFQADDTAAWVHVENGSVPLNDGGEAGWMDNLEDFPELVAQYEECMKDPGYRHQAEKAAMQHLVLDQPTLS